MPRETYPPARRLDVVDDLHGHDVPDPYRWLEDAADRADTEAWSQRPGRAGPPRARRASRAATGCARRLAQLLRRRRRRRPGLARRARVLHAPRPRPGARRAADRRPRRHRARARRPDGARPGRHDDARRLAAVEGGRPAGLPALRRRHEESRAARPRRRHRRGRRRADRPRRYSPVAWLPGGEELLLRAPARPRRWCPPARSSSTAGCGCTGSAPTPTTTSLVFGAGRDTTNYYGVTSAATAAGCSSPRPPGTAPRNDLWLADLARPTARAPRPAGRAGRTSTRRPRCTSAATAGCYVYHRPRRPARPARRRRPRHDPGPTRGATSLPEDPRPCSRTSRSSTAPELATPVLLASWTRHAVSEVTRARPGDRRRARRRPAARPRHRSPGCPSAPRAATRLVRLHRPHHAAVVLPLRRAHRPDRPLWASAPGPVEVPDGARASSRRTPSTDGTPVRMFVLSPRRRRARRARGRRSSTATAVSACR